MGWVEHDAIIVTDHSYGTAIDKAHNFASGLSHLCVTPIIDSVVNGYRTFLVGPDGSKSGWEDDKEGEKQRDIFIGWMKEWNKICEDGYLDFVHVRYGGDWRGARVEEFNGHDDED